MKLPEREGKRGERGVGGVIESIPMPLVLAADRGTAEVLNHAGRVARSVAVRSLVVLTAALGESSSLS